MRTLLIFASLCTAGIAESRFQVSLINRGGPPFPPYTTETGVGCEPGVPDAHGAFFVSFKVPEEGNYRVTVKLGAANHASVTTVKAELRRLMLERVATKPGNYETRTFVVNVRRPEIAGGTQVKLKDREKTSETWAWDDKLTLEFSGDEPSFQKILVEKTFAHPTLFIAGDSTSTDQGAEPYNSWGQMITRFFQPTIAIANHGESGESLRSFYGENRMAKLMSRMGPGDWLFIQMGHNDQKEKDLPAYKNSLKRMIAEARQQGATPVLITPMHRLSFDDSGHIVNTLGDYPETVRQTAAEEHVALLDLNRQSKILYEAWGPVNAPRAFAPGDKTHHNDYGSYELAKCIVQAIRDAKLPLAQHLLPGAPFDPAHPDDLASFALPADPTRPAEKPYGN